MKPDRINPLLAGTTLVFEGFFALYFESYRNNQIIDFISIALLILGWGVIYDKVTKGTTINAHKVSFSVNKMQWFKRTVINFLVRILLITTIGGSGFAAFVLGRVRMEKILDAGPSKVAIAEVSGIETHNGRYTKSYFAVFEYKVGNEFIEHPVFESSELDYIVTQKYEILYSVEHPEMFRILRKLR